MSNSRSLVDRPRHDDGRLRGVGPLSVARSSFDRRPFLVAAAVFAVLMVVSPFYGFHRDELYFLDCARHLQASYVDQPVLTPLIARLSLELFGVSVSGLRLFPALAAAATVLIGALIARELGGGSRPQLMAAIATATMPALLAIDHLMGPTAFDVLAWAALYLFILRVETRANPRWWVPAGAVLGLGLANKHSIGFFALTLIVGLLLAGGRRVIWNRWFGVGAAIALACTVPDLWWQATHGWATVTMTRNLNAENGGAGHIADWLVGQLVMSAFALIPVWIAALVWFWKSRLYVGRALVISYAVLFVFFAVTTGSKIYYLAGAYIPLLAGGAIMIDHRLDSRAHARSLATGLAISVVAALPIALPVLPATDAQWAYGINQVGGETVGWPSLVRTVETAWRALPAGLRPHALIVASNYGEAGAINELGRGRGLPVALGDQNSEWWWGIDARPPSAVLAVAPGPRSVTGYDSYLRQFFSSVRAVATLDNSAGFHNQEWHGHVYLCRGLTLPWATTWRELRHYQ
jgi:4-amino-4-deoxy-L-arabinose transferase-like glycosyltransferase